MESHRGKFIKRVIQKEGYTITKIAKQLKVNRVTLYNKFKAANLSRDFILKVGKIIKYDFTLDFPEMRPPSKVPSFAMYRKEFAEFETEKVIELLTLEKKYTRLLSYHNQLLSLLICIIDEKELHFLKKEVTHLIKEKKENIVSGK